MKKVTDKALAVRFLRSGDDSGLKPVRLFAACDLLIRGETQKSSVRAVKLGRKFVSRLRRGDREGQLVAYRALGWALLVHNDYPAAAKIYLKARKLCLQSGLSRARIDRVLIDVYMYLDNTDEARHRARLAMRTFKRLGAEEDLAKTRVNYANLLHRLDRHRQANLYYAEAAAFFSKRRNPLATALCYYNQANTLVQLFDLKAAEPLYRKARTIFKRKSHDLWACNCLNGLAWLHMLQGSFHDALQELLESEAGFNQIGQRREVVLCQLDRAEVYFSLNLLTDARNTARESERSARKLGIAYETAKSAFFFAKASFGMGRLAEARHALKRAIKHFRRMGNSSFQGATKLLEAQIGAGRKASYRQIEEARKGFSKRQLPLWEAICDLQIACDWPDKDASLRRLATNPAVKTVPHLMAQWLTVEGDRNASRGRVNEACIQWTKAANILDGVRAKLPPVDLRSSFIRRQPSQPHRKLIQALIDKDPGKAAAWSERLKTSGKWTTSTRLSELVTIRRKAGESLDLLASQVTSLASQLSPKSRHSVSSNALVPTALTKLQQRVRVDLSRLKYSAETVPHIEAVKEQLAKAALKRTIVQFHVHNGEFHAFVHRGESMQVYTFVDGTQRLSELVGCWRFLVERRVHASGNPTRADMRDEHRLLERIGSWLWKPLEVPVDTKVLVLPEGNLANLPWHALIVNGQTVLERHSLILAPSLRHHLYAARNRSRSDRIKVFVGSTEGLKRPEQDYTRITQHKNSIIYRQCRRADWPDNSRAAIWHYVGHADMRADNPFYSSLVLNDGRIFAADFLLKRNTVDLITLAACRTGQQTNLPGEESTGLVRSLLEMGARNVIASHWAVNDRSSASWMNSFYSAYLDNNGLIDAYRKAALETRERYPSAYHWSAFSIFGAGN